jgi:hypothetical protein
VDRLVIVAAPSGGQAGVALGPLTVEARDRFGNRALNAAGELVVTASGGPGTLSGPTTQPLDQGQATFPGLVLSRAGTYTLTARLGETLTASTQVVIAVGPPSQLVVVSAPSPNPVSTTGSFGFTVAVRDVGGDPVPSYTGVGTVSVLSGPGALSGTASVGFLNGQAQFAGLRLLAAGSYSLGVVTGGLSTTVSVTVTAPPPVTFFIVSGSGQVGAPGDSLPVKLRVRLLGPGGVPAAGRTIVWTNASPGGTFGAPPPQAVTDAGGYAEGTYKLGATPGTYIVTATTPDVPGTTLTFVNTAVVPPTTAVTWNGSVSGDWHTAANWTPAVVPTSTVDVTIPNLYLLFTPTISGAAALRNLTIEYGGEIGVACAGTMTIAGNASLEGSIFDSCVTLLDGADAVDRRVDARGGARPSPDRARGPATAALLAERRARRARASRPAVTAAPESRQAGVLRRALAPIPTPMSSPRVTFTGAGVTIDDVSGYGHIAPDVIITGSVTGDISAGRVFVDGTLTVVNSAAVYYLYVRPTGGLVMNDPYASLTAYYLAAFAGAASALTQGVLYIGDYFDGDGRLQQQTTPAAFRPGPLFSVYFYGGSSVEFEHPGPSSDPSASFLRNVTTGFSGPPPELRLDGTLVVVEGDLDATGFDVFGTAELDITGTFTASTVALDDVTTRLNCGGTPCDPFVGISDFGATGVSFVGTNQNIDASHFDGYGEEIVVRSPATARFTGSWATGVSQVDVKSGATVESATPIGAGAFKVVSVFENSGTVNVPSGMQILSGGIWLRTGSTSNVLGSWIVSGAASCQLDSPYTVTGSGLSIGCF